MRDTDDGPGQPRSLIWCLSADLSTVLFRKNVLKFTVCCFYLRKYFKMSAQENPFLFCMQCSLVPFLSCWPQSCGVLYKLCIFSRNQLDVSILPLLFTLFVILLFPSFYLNSWIHSLVFLF